MGAHIVFIVWSSRSQKGLILNFFDVWDFGKSLFDGADPRTPSETHPVVMICQLTLWRSRAGIMHRYTRKVRGSGMEAFLGCNRSSEESMLIDPLEVEDI